MNALVSIIIPCHNAAPWLAETLGSALGQTGVSTEIILVDDGSTDASLDIARGFERAGVRVVAQTNAGASAARNHGLRLAQGDFIQFLDADDLLTPPKIAGQVDLLQRTGSDGIASCRWGRFTKDPAEATFVDEAVFRDFSPLDWMIEHTQNGRMMHPAAWLVPRRVADRAGPWDESLSLNDDGEYFARMVLASRRVSFSPEGASLYRSALPGSLSRRRDRRALESLFRSTELVAGHVLAAKDSDRVRRALADYWQRLIFELYPSARDLCRRAEARVQMLGGSTLQPAMGARERQVARLLGWRLARRLRSSFPS